MTPRLILLTILCTWSLFTCAQQNARRINSGEIIENGISLRNLGSFIPYHLLIIVIGLNCLFASTIKYLPVAMDLKSQLCRLLPLTRLNDMDDTNLPSILYRLNIIFSFFGAWIFISIISATGFGNIVIAGAVIFVLILIVGE